MTSPFAISVDNVEKKYKRGVFRRKTVDALRGVSLDVQAGEIFGLLGPNGAGKTTLIKILLGIVRRSAGDAQVLGLEAGSRRGREQIGYLPENHRIPRHLTGNTALEYYGELNRVPLRDIRANQQRLLDTVGLSEWGSAPVKTYSKGMQQRLGLAQAMLHDPKLLILDEPTDGVDPVGRAKIRETLFMLKEQGKTVFLNSHLLQELELVCDRVAILQNGQVKHVGKVEELTEASSSELKFRVHGPLETVKQSFANVPNLPEHQIETNSNSHVIAVDIAEQSQIDATVDQLRQSGVSIEAIYRDRLTLEQVFLQMVQSENSDDQAANESDNLSTNEQSDRNATRSKNTQQSATETDPALDSTTKNEGQA
jgi:ABC-2 type transport system ATP-binding protein